MTNMNNMFLNAKKFNQDLRKWNVSNVVKFGCMFCGSPMIVNWEKQFKTSENRD